MSDNNYEIVSVQPTEPPANAAGTGWHCYVIRQGINTIRGYQQGDIDKVSQVVRDIVLRLNERRRGKFGRTQLVIPAQGKKTGSQ